MRKRRTTVFRPRVQDDKLEEMDMHRWAFAGGIFRLLENIGDLGQKRGFTMVFSPKCRQ